MPNFKYPNNYDDDFINTFKEVLDYLNRMGYTYEESLQKAQDILEEAQQTNDMNESVQQQINTLIAESGTSDAEVLQARVDAKGNEYPVLKDRLDENDAQLAEKASKEDIAVFVRDYKTGSNTWQDALQQSVNYVESIGGGTVILPKKTLVECVKVGEKNTEIFSNAMHSYCIDIGSNTNIDLNESTIKLADAQNASLFVTKNMLFSKIPTENITIYNGTIDINCQNQTTPTQSTMDGITFFNLIGLKLKNIYYKNIRQSSFKLLAVKNFFIDDQYTENSDGDAYRLGAIDPDSPHDQRCVDGSIGTLHAENCSINKSGSLQGNPVIADLKNVVISQLIAKDCGGGYKFQGGCENLTIGRAIFNGAEVKDIYNSSENSGFKVQGSASKQPTNITVGEVISTNCEGQGLYIEDTSDVTIGSYIGVDNGGAGTREDVRIGKGKRTKVNSINSKNAGQIGVLVRSDADDYQLGIVSVFNAGSATNSDGIQVLGLSGTFDSVIVKDDRTTKKMTYGFRVPETAGVCIVNNLNVDGALTAPLALNNALSEIKKVILSESEFTHGEITLASGMTQTDVVNVNATRVYSSNRYTQPVIELIPINDTARALVTNPLRYYSAQYPSNGFTIRHGESDGTEKFIYRITGYISTPSTIN